MSDWSRNSWDGANTLTSLNTRGMRISEQYFVYFVPKCVRVSLIIKPHCDLGYKYHIKQVML